MKFLAICGGCLFGALTSVALAQNPLGNPLAERIVQLQLSADKLFYEPATPWERSAFMVGAHHHWARYGQKEAPERGAFRGYALFADPYHLGQKRISFLIGADCTRFVHRLYQLLGAEFSYAKTRHLIHLSKSLREQAKPADYVKKVQAAGQIMDMGPQFLCHLQERFELLASAERHPERWQAGDLLLFVDKPGVAGEHGHVAMVLKGGEVPTLLHAHGARKGIVEDSLPSVIREEGSVSFVLRWKGREPLRPLPPEANIATLLQAQYPAEIEYQCENRLGKGDGENGRTGP